MSDSEDALLDLWSCYLDGLNNWRASNVTGYKTPTSDEFIEDYKFRLMHGGFSRINVMRLNNLREWAKPVPDRQYWEDPAEVYCEN